MANRCNNYLTVSASSDNAKKQLKEFVEKSISADNKFSYQPLLPVPEDLKIADDSNTEYGLAIIQARNGDPLALNTLLKSPWCRKYNISTIQELEDYLLTNNFANLANGRKALENIAKYGCKSWYDWCLKHWGVKWDASEVEVLTNKDDECKIYFYSPYNPPDEWLVRVSKMFPDLVFSDDYQIVWTNVITEGLFEIRNCEVIHEEVDQAPFKDQIESDYVKDYGDGYILTPQDANNEPLPFKLFVKESKYIIALCHDNYEIKEEKRQLNILESILQEVKRDNKNFLKYSVYVRDNKIIFNFFIRVDKITITETINECSNILESIREKHNLRFK